MGLPNYDEGRISKIKSSARVEIFDQKYTLRSVIITEFKRDIPKMMNNTEEN